jgi:hypothetical protein
VAEQADKLVQLRAFAELGEPEQVASGTKLAYLVDTGCLESIESVQRQAKLHDARFRIYGIWPFGSPVARAKLHVHIEGIDDSQHDPEQRRIVACPLKPANNGALYARRIGNGLLGQFQAPSLDAYGDANSLRRLDGHWSGSHGGAH